MIATKFYDGRAEWDDTDDLLPTVRTLGELIAWYTS